MAKITVCGNMTTKEIKVHTSKDGKEYVTFTICDNPFKKNKDSKPVGEMTPYKVICWNEFAQLMKKEGKPRRQFTVTGYLVPSVWTKDGKTYHGMEIRANEIKPGRMPNFYNKKENDAA